jgi:hypothetical protein
VTPTLDLETARQPWGEARGRAWQMGLATSRAWCATGCVQRIRFGLWGVRWATRAAELEAGDRGQRRESARRRSQVFFRFHAPLQWACVCFDLPCTFAGGRSGRREQRRACRVISCLCRLLSKKTAAVRRRAADACGCGRGQIGSERARGGFFAQARRLAACCTGTCSTAGARWQLWRRAVLHAVASRERSSSSGRW